MKIGYFNTELTDDAVRITFLGRDAAGKSRRPLIEFDAHDLAAMVATVKDFRDHQLALAKKHSERADKITRSLENT